MPRCDWSDLPAEVRARVQVCAGVVRNVEPAATGEHSDIASTLHTSRGRVFVKGARIDGPDARWLRREATINAHVRQYAPRLVWEIEAGGWLLLGFQHVQGRHADFSPGSADLVHLAKVLETCQSMPCPEPVNRRVERRWSNYTDDVSPMSGEAMLHTDINPGNLLVTDERVYVIDWGWASVGAAWVELALLVQWLIGAGHTPRQAEQWLSAFQSWNQADPAALDMFATANADRWRNLTTEDSPAWARRLAELTRQWANYRTA